VDNEFSVEERNEGSAWVLATSGELDLRTSPELEERLARVWASGAELVIPRHRAQLRMGAAARRDRFFVIGRPLKIKRWWGADSRKAGS
jgi:hypothetical protein